MRNLLLFKSIQNAEQVIEEPKEFLEKLKAAAENYTSQQLLYSVDVLLEVLPRLESTEAKQTLLEITILKLLYARKRVSLDEIFARLAALESGSPIVQKEQQLIQPAIQAASAATSKEKSESKEDKKKKLIEKAKQDPLVKQAFDLFPGSEIVDVEE